MNCEEAFRFYEKHLGGKITMMMNQSWVPGSAAGAGTAIIHARMDIADTGVSWTIIHEKPRT